MSTTRRSPWSTSLLASCAAALVAVAGCSTAPPTARPDADTAPPPALETLNAPLPDKLLGLAPNEADRIRTTCLEQNDFRGPTGDVRLRALTDFRGDLASADTMGQLAVLVGAEVVMVCRIIAPEEMAYLAGSPPNDHVAIRAADGTAANWLSGAVEVDLTATTQVGEPGSEEVKPGSYHMVVGRVTRDVEKVVVNGGDGREVAAAVSGGAYVATVFVNAATIDELVRQPPLVVRALSADGTELGRTDGTPACFTIPTDRSVIGTRRPGDSCAAGVRWP